MQPNPRKKSKGRWGLRAVLVCLIAAQVLAVGSCGRKNDTPQETSGVSDITDGTDRTQEVTSAPKPPREPEQIQNFGKIDYTAGEGLLWNGIRLPEEWPPRDVDPMRESAPDIPYLIPTAEGGTKPDVIDITVGRQLFVDSFLIASTDLKTVYHHAQKYEGNPVLKPGTLEEISGSWGVGCSSGGIWYDMQDGIYKMWYDVPFNRMLGYAESEDGIHWKRVKVDESGTNIVLGEALKNGTCSVLIDYFCDPSEKYKMLVHSLNNEVTDTEGYETISGGIDDHSYASTLYVSADGIHWAQKGGVSKSLSGDMTTAYFDAFRGKWINSLRTYAMTKTKGTLFKGRVRYYAEHDSFEDLLNWRQEDAVFWMKCDNLDPIDAGSGKIPQVYNFNAIAYESLMLGTFTIWRGPENNVIEKTGNPKKNELLMSYSRDGFWFDRPDRTAFIGVGADGDFDKGYLFASVGSIIVHDDLLYIYYSGFSGYNGTTKNAHGNQAIGLATIRRDGFASLDGSGSVTTGKLTVNGDKKYLFVNIDAPEQSFRAEILDENGQVMEGYSMADCIAVGGDDTCLQLTWRNGKDLSCLNGKVFSIRFSMEGNGSFYSFWLSDSLRGESGGAVAAGYAGK
ncbi:MAG TPA: hypothetical protein DDW30_01120 [Clostridiales bacterium]|nr:hypothetical protein [Clostridiales bacterium]